MHEQICVVAGHICLDIILNITGKKSDKSNSIFLPGRLNEVAPAILSTGGIVSNVGIALYKLGINTKLIGKVGNDFFGKAITQLLSSLDETLSNRIISGREINTSYTLIINQTGIDRILFHHPGANDTFSVNDINYDEFKNVKIFHFGYPPLMKSMYEDGGEQLNEIFRLVKERGVTTSLDMALPDSSTASGKADWKRILQKTLPNVDIFLPGIEEIIYMLHRDIYEKENLANKWPSFLLNLRPDFLHNMSQEILDMGVKIVGFKLGERGFYLKTAEKTKIVLSTKDFPIDPGLWANRELWAPCFKVDVVGTAGSGDATIAGFLTGLLRGMSIEEAAILAVAVGACSVEKADTISGIRSFEDTVKRIYSRWEMHELAINSPGWHYNEKDNLWIFE